MTEGSDHLVAAQANEGVNRIFGVPEAGEVARMGRALSYLLPRSIPLISLLYYSSFSSKYKLPLKMKARAAAQ